MKRLLAGLFLISSCWIAFAQTPVTGSGTTNTIPIWTSSTALGNSAITQSGSNVGIGGATSPGARLYVLTNSNGGEAILGNNTSKSQNTMPVGVAGVSNGLLGVGVYGQTNSTTGATVGTVGITVSPSGMGVEGINDASSGAGGDASGVMGVFNGGSGNGSGVIGISSSPQGSGVLGESIDNIGVSGTTSGSTGIAGYFDNSSAGSLLVGAVKGVHKFRVDGTGKGFFDGGTQTGGADFAESVAIGAGEGRREPGDLMVVDRGSSRQLTLATEPYSTLVAGIYSTKPGVLATPHLMAENIANEIPLAIVGIVPCKVSAENGPILPGDLLVTSATPGHAMKGTERNRMLGAVVGKALEPLSAGKGVIQVLVTLQ
jgi:hypothetical protein